MPPDFAIFDRITLAIANGSSMRAACADHKVPIATYHDWKRKHAERGHITDQRRHKSGRKPAWELTDEEALAVRKWNMVKGSVNEGMKWFIRDRKCRPETREWMHQRLDTAAQLNKDVSWPESIHRAAHVTDDERRQFAGKKATQAGRPSTRTHLEWIHNGVSRPLITHTCWIFDDYSTNQPYFIEYDRGLFRCCRQVLAAKDMATRGWLGFDHIGKERDQYTAADCLRVILRCIESHGTKPDAIVLEGGRWQGNAIHGIPMENGGRWGSIADAGIVLKAAIGPRDKREIEYGFHLLQKELSECGADIGRHRDAKEIEQANLVAVNQGRKDPRACGFLSKRESEEAHQAAAAALNGQPMQRQDLNDRISPDALDDRWKGQRPARPLLPEERWLFLPLKEEATVRRGAIEITRKDINPNGWVFRVNGVSDDVFLGDGHKVFIAFDPQDLDLGCLVANRETGPLNRKHYRLGQPLLMAPYETSVARLTTGDAPDEPSESWKHRKNALKMSSTAFRAILPNGRHGLRVEALTLRTGAAAQAYSDRSKRIVPQVPTPEVPAEEPSTTARIALPENRPAAPEATAPRATAARIALPADRSTSDAAGASRLPRATAARIALPADRPTADSAETPRAPRATAARLSAPREHTPADDHDTASIF